MKVKFLTNLGTRDAAELGLKADDCQYGETVNVPEVAASKLEARGFVEVIEKPQPKTEQPPKVDAVPDKPAVAEAKKPSVSGSKSSTRSKGGK